MKVTHFDHNGSDRHVMIELTQGKVAMIDLEDEALVRAHKWSLKRSRDTYYAQTRAPKRDGKQQTTVMHRLIMGAKFGDPEVDHVNGNGLDNRRVNLRFSTDLEQARNRGIRSDNTSGYKGVYRDRGRWSAHIGVNGRLFHIGSFETPEEAAQAYDAQAVEIFGEFARTNGAPS